MKKYPAGWGSSALPSCPTATAQNAETWPHPNYEAAGANFVNNQHLKHEVLDFDREIWRKVISIHKFYDTFAEEPPICLDYIRYYIILVSFCSAIMFCFFWVNILFLTKWQPGIHKGQKISKDFFSWNFNALKLNEKFWRISALASKKRQIKKNKWAFFKF